MREIELEETLEQLRSEKKRLKTKNEELQDEIDDVKLLLVKTEEVLRKEQKEKLVRLSVSIVKKILI